MSTQMILINLCSKWILNKGLFCCFVFDSAEKLNKSAFPSFKWQANKIALKLESGKDLLQSSLGCISIQRDAYNSTPWAWAQLGLPRGHCFSSWIWVMTGAVKQFWTPFFKAKWGIYCKWWDMHQEDDKNKPVCGVEETKLQPRPQHQAMSPSLFINIEMRSEGVLWNVHPFRPPRIIGGATLTLTRSFQYYFLTLKSYSSFDAHFIMLAACHCPHLWLLPKYGPCLLLIFEKLCLWEIWFLYKQWLINSPWFEQMSPWSF